MSDPRKNSPGALSPAGADSAENGLPRLNLPRRPQRVKPFPDGVTRIFDRLRQKFVALTPEEWVRQHFVGLLVDHLGYPPALMANEVAIRLNDTMRRCDTVLFAPQCIPGEPLRPRMIVEYKAPHIPITRKVFDQIARYNIVMGARMLIVSNGMHHFCCLTPPAAPPRFLRDIPDYATFCKITAESSPE